MIRPSATSNGVARRSATAQRGAQSAGETAPGCRPACAPGARRCGRTCASASLRALCFVAAQLEARAPLAGRAAQARPGQAQHRQQVFGQREVHARGRAQRQFGGDALDARHAHLQAASRRAASAAFVSTSVPVAGCRRWLSATHCPATHCSWRAAAPPARRPAAGRRRRLQPPARLAGRRARPACGSAEPAVGEAVLQLTAVSRRHAGRGTTCARRGRRHIHPGGVVDRLEGQAPLQSVAGCQIDLSAAVREGRTSP